MWLLVGLGNPGDKYARNRHNIGFMALDRLADKYSAFTSWKSKHQGLIADASLSQQKIVLLKPQTFMNNSGPSVSAAARFYKIPPERVVVFYDELDLVPGKIRVKRGGGNGGHNGLRSIDAHFGKDYWRVRLGIGHPGDKERVIGHVLGDFSSNERAWLDPLLDSLALHLPFLLAGKFETYQSKIAQDSPAPK